MSEGGGEVERKRTLELGWHNLLPSVKWSTTWTETVAARSSRFVDHVGDAADLAADELAAVLEDDEERRDLFVAGVQRAGEVADQDYRDGLSRVVGAAFHDEALVDEVSMLAAAVSRLEPLHLRVLGVALQPAYVLTLQDRRPVVRPLDLRLAMRNLRITPAAAQAAADALIGAGFVRRTDVDLPKFINEVEKARKDAERNRLSFRGRVRQAPPTRLVVTTWGQEALALCHPFTLDTESVLEFWEEYFLEQAGTAQRRRDFDAMVADQQARAAASPPTVGVTNEEPPPMNGGPVPGAPGEGS